MKKDEMKERESEAAPITESRSGGTTMPADVLRCQCCDAPVPGARRTRSPENQMSMCLPRDSTRSMVRPEIGVVSSTRVRRGKTDSKRVTARPASARCIVLAAR